MKALINQKVEQNIQHTGTLLSVIIPAHNAEATLRRAAESALRAFEAVEADAGPQCEILIIENGSEDGTASAAGQLQAEHPGVIRFLQSEKGVSNARNRGLEEAKGTWILFLDADDVFTEEAGEILRDDMQFSGTDLIVHSYYAGSEWIHLCPDRGERFAGTGAGRGEKALSQADRKDRKDRMDRMDRKDRAREQSGRARGRQEADPRKESSAAGGQGTGPGIEEIAVRMIENPTRYTTVWSKLFRRERIAYGQLRFDPALRLSEDSLFLIRYLELCRRIRLLDRPFYRYSTDNTSAVRTWDGKKEEGYRAALEAVQRYLRTQPEEIREAGAGYGMMQFNLLMVREVFSLQSPLSAGEKVSSMKRISREEPFAAAIAAYDPKRHKGIRYLPFRLMRRGLYAAAAAVYEGRALQNLRKEKAHGRR